LPIELLALYKLHKRMPKNCSRKKLFLIVIMRDDYRLKLFVYIQAKQTFFWKSVSPFSRINIYLYRILISLDFIKAAYVWYQKHFDELDSSEDAFTQSALERLSQNPCVWLSDRLFPLLCYR